MDYTERAFLLFVQNEFMCIYSEGVIPVINTEEYLQVTYSMRLDLRKCLSTQVDEEHHFLSLKK